MFPFHLCYYNYFSKKDPPRRQGLELQKPGFMSIIRFTVSNSRYSSACFLLVRRTINRCIYIYRLYMYTIYTIYAPVLPKRGEAPTNGSWAADCHITLTTYHRDTYKRPHAQPSSPCGMERLLWGGYNKGTCMLASPSSGVCSHPYHGGVPPPWQTLELVHI